MEIRPAHVEQVHRAKGGRMVAITADVGGVAQQLKDIDPGLHLRYAEGGDYFVVYHESNGQEYLVLTAQDCDARIVRRVQQIASTAYDFVKEIEREQQAKDKAGEERMREEVAEKGERLAHAMRADLNLNQGTISVSRTIS